MPLFVALTVYFGLRSTGQQPFLRFAAGRARRLLLPWVLWSLLYGLLIVRGAYRAGLPLFDAFSPTVLLTGTALHLWFLPFAFVAILACRLVQVWIPRNSTGLFLFLGIFVSGTVATAFALEAHGRVAPGEQWLSATPAVLLGFALVLAERVRWGLALVLCVALSVFSTLRLSGLPYGTMEYLITSVLTVAILAWPVAARPCTVLLSQLSIGIYLVHPLAMSVTFSRIIPMPPGAAETALLAIVVSVMVAAAMLGMERLVRAAWRATSSASECDGMEGKRQ